MLQERGTVAPGLLAQIIVSKYCDHMPLYRQEQIYWTRHRVWLPRQNLAHWMEVAADWLKPIYQHIRTGVMAGGYVQVDETPVRLPRTGKWQNQDRLLLDHLASRWRCRLPVGNQPGGSVPGQRVAGRF